MVNTTRKRDYNKSKENNLENNSKDENERSDLDDKLSGEEDQYEEVNPDSNQQNSKPTRSPVRKLAKIVKNELKSVQQGKERNMDEELKDSRRSTGVKELEFDPEFESSDDDRRSQKKGKKRKKFVNTRFTSDEESEDSEESDIQTDDTECMETVTTPVKLNSEEFMDGNLNENNNKAKQSKKAKTKRKRVEDTSSSSESESFDESSSSSSDSSDEERGARSRRHKKHRKKSKKRRSDKGKAKPTRKGGKQSRKQELKLKKKSKKDNYLKELERLRAEVESVKQNKGEKSSDGNICTLPKNSWAGQQTPKNHRTGQQKTKSHSDTSIYAPAVAVADNQTVVSPNLAKQANKQNTDKFNEDAIANFIKQIRVSNVSGEPRHSTVRSEVFVPTQGHSGDVSAGQVDGVQKARADAHANVIAAEKYKATLAPTGMVPNVLQYVDPDDDFFHTTCHVEASLREKIKRGEFVELEKLLTKRTKHSRTDGGDQRMEIINKDGKAYLTPVTDRDSKITNVHRWDQAFRVYATIYSEGNPTRAAEIWQYVDVIHRAARAFNWENVANYDYVFRQLMAANPTRKWSKTYTQMWNLNLCEPLTKVGGTSGAFGKNNSSTPGGKPDGICWRYNKNKCKYGDQCRYEHRCSYCFKLGHPATKCYKKNGNNSKGKMTGGQTGKQENNA